MTFLIEWWPLPAFAFYLAFCMMEGFTMDDVRWFEYEPWLAWYPVRATGIDGTLRIAWLETVFRKRLKTGNGAGRWRYYTN